MKLIRQYEFGPAENLRYEDAPDLQPGPGQVRIDVAAAGVHLIDTTFRKGIQAGPPLPTLPYTPGREVAGTVALAGPGVDPAWLGKRVTAHLGMVSGGYASQALANVDSLHVVSDNASFEEAVAMIGTGRTAMGILTIAALTTDDVVLVTSAAGGLGALLLQAARSVGARTIAAAGGAAKLDLVDADVKRDYLEQDWAQGLDPKPTVVLEAVGGEIGRTAMKALAPGGRLVMYGFSAGSMIELSAGDLYSGSISAHVALGPALLKGGMRGLEERSMAALAARELVPLITTFPLAEAAKAQTALETRATVGKTVLLP
ncbi:oxidoreductase [Rhizocola hellebori]|uniref:Oxidoreductase n=1 Tax=Rhizocola hellebori TaxID=1392758 RepID=A0A8J3Q623_9ACTN|nr:zinc-binding dehydrogenase [Rhizocola hellebori]GIH04069.1 oxidoreductase [Rhizocola hellebori]